jgi:type I restriction enzyme M protein
MLHLLTTIGNAQLTNWVHIVAETKTKAPPVDDYPIFFATSRSSGKDNSGNYVYETDEQGNRLLDEHGHLIVDHDLDEIATAFALFAKEQRLSFWKDDDRPF